MEIELKAVGNRIRKVRLEAGLSGEEFGTRLGISKGAVSTYEIGGSFPRWETLNRIVALSGKDFNWLLGGRDAEDEVMKASVPSLDEPLLRDVIDGIESGLAELELSLTPVKKAELVVLLYGMMAEEEGKRPNKDQLEKILRLVA